jgi:integrase
MRTTVSNTVPLIHASSERRPPRRTKITPVLVRKVRSESKAFAIWDTHLKGFCLRVQPTGQKSFKVVYSWRGQPRWYHIGDAKKLTLKDAQTIGRKVLYQVADGEDPYVADKRARWEGETFEQVYKRYLTEHAMRNLKSWEQGKYHVERHVVPEWSKILVKDITRRDVRALFSKIESRSTANAVLAHTSSIFKWLTAQEIIATNPCTGIEGHPMKARSRVLSDTEVASFWATLDRLDTVAARILKVLLLTGQRSVEVKLMRWEHIRDGVWHLPGAPDPKVGWEGTKSGTDHRVWLPKAAWQVIGDHRGIAGFVFNDGGRTVGRLDKAMRSTGIEGATPHDLRRTHGSTVTRLGFGRDAMNRIQNHREGGIADTYDWWHYFDETKQVMEKVADHITTLARSEKIDQRRFTFGRRDHTR